MVAERILHPVNEGAEIIGLSRRHAYREMAAGRLEYVTVGRKRLIPHEALENYATGLRQTTRRRRAS
jgi:excisionase family DNA binding protein